MLFFVDEAYEKADEVLGGWLPGGGTANPLSNTVKEGALKVRDDIVDAYNPPLHKDLFIKAHTGGVSGDGVLRELPKNVLETIKTQTEKYGSTSRKTEGFMSLYGSGNVEANLGLGTVGVYFDKDGNVLIKDKWKVDKPKGKQKFYNDLTEGGQLASDIHNAALDLGTYKDIPIEVRLTKQEWERLQAAPAENWDKYKEATKEAVRNNKFSKNVLRTID